MVRSLLKRHLAKNRALILLEGRRLHDFMRLLMKPRNTGVKWTKQEKGQLKAHLKHLSFTVPVLVIFALPFGSLLIPILAEVLDRREKSRRDASPRLGGSGGEDNR